MDKLNQLTKPFRRLMLNSSARSLFDEDFTVVTFTAQQSGERLSLPADFVRQEAVVYLLIDKDDNRWKKLIKGVPVNIFFGDIQYSGWAEDLTGYDEFFKVLSANPLKLSELVNKYNLPESETQIKSSTQFEDFLGKYKLIRVKISR